ncbi:MAG: DUF3592 domain-containing protein [Chloroflexi bacterium]|nr:DUF3592 domain-containing protein [Chloroflexota bacterium]
MENISIETLIAVGSICFSEIIISVILLGIIFVARQGSAKAQNWAATAGRVMLSTLEARRGSNGQKVYYPVVQYQYRVHAMDYESRKIMPGMEWGGSGASAVVAKYPAGSTVTVYYNPENPAEALLERDIPKHTVWLWVALVVSNLFMCGLAVLLFFTI